MKEFSDHPNGGPRRWRRWTSWMSSHIRRQDTGSGLGGGYVAVGVGVGKWMCNKLGDLGVDLKQRNFTLNNLKHLRLGRWIYRFLNK